MGLIAEFGDFMERIPRAAWHISLPLIAVGGSVRIGAEYKLFRPDTMDGLIVDGAGAALAAGLGILALGLFYSAVRIPARLMGYLAAWNESRGRASALEENLNFIPVTAELLLYSALQQPSGRIPAIPTRSFELLWQQKLLVEDVSGPYVSFGGPPTSGMVKVAPELFDRRKRVGEKLKKRLGQTLHGDLDDPQYVESALADAIQTEHYRI